MKIKEIILEGFKSYGNRTQLDNLDPEFTAITGLNGSGKSNVLDAICFVLGLQSLTLNYEARASKIQDLVYKGGQAGIKEASVTIFFDNRNKQCSPPGYHDCDVISVSRKIIGSDKTKYYVNGSTATAVNVKRMFKSIGLNIDHPETFFVQQGRITQIVSFKPMEIMEMLMESAGVALYHEISDNTRGVMKEKSEKLDITQQRMKMNFGPKLKQLEKERAKLAEHESLQAQMSEKKGIETRLKKYQAQKTVKMGTETLKNYEKTLSENNKIKAFFKSQLDNLHKEAESDSGELKGIFKELGDLKAKTQEMKSLLATSTNEKSEKLREKNKKTDQIQNLRVKQAEKEKSLARAQATKESMEQLIERLKERLEGLAEEKQTMASKGESGSNSDDPSKPIASRIVRLKNDLLQRKDDLERTKNEIKKIQEYIKSGERSKQKIDQELKDYQTEEKELQEEEGKLINLEVEKIRPLKAKLQDASSDDRRFQERLRNNNINLEEFSLDYRNPHADFDRKLVYGRAYQLIKVNPEFLTALEVGCGGKFMGIAVENDNVSKLLLNRKCFNYFVQFYPLNTMTYKPIPEEVIRRAEQIAAKFKAKIYLPWDPSVSQPINPRFKIIHQFCTSNFLICNNMEAAAEIIKSRVPVMIVTTEGDSFDPSGEGFGGFRGDKVSIPYKWFKYQELVEEKKKEESNLGQDGQHQTKAQMMEELKKLQEEKAWLEQEKDAFARKAERLERVREQIQNFKGKLVFDSSSKYASQLPIFEEREKQEREDIERLKKEIENNDNMLKEIRKGSDVKAMFLINLKKLSEEEEKIAKEKEKAQKQLAESTTTIDNEKKEIEETKSRIKDTEKGIDLLTNVLEERSKYLASQQAKIEEMEREYEDLQQKVKEKQEKDEEAKQKAKEFGEKVSSASDQIDRLNEQIKKLKEDMNQARENFKDDPSLEHAPFQTDEQLEKIEVKKFDKEFKEIKERFYNLDKQINKEAESMGNRLEEQMQDLANKENILKQDKEQIYTNLEHLDEKSQQSVLQCFEFVNKHLGEIFNILLPGAMAHMELVDTTVGRGEKTKTIKGIKMKIGFNGHWKESMTELSGGQRSLLALSFLLAMLKYRAAPFYILDEIDSAMDLSHTENVGYIISKFFPQSQFIVISLKGGLFNAANIIFRTNLVDGRSQINRYDNRKDRKRHRNAMIEDREERGNTLDRIASQNN